MFANLWHYYVCFATLRQVYSAHGVTMVSWKYFRSSTCSNYFLRGIISYFSIRNYSKTVCRINIAQNVCFLPKDNFNYFQILRINWFWSILSHFAVGKNNKKNKKKNKKNKHDKCLFYAFANNIGADQPCLHAVWSAPSHTRVACCGTVALRMSSQKHIYIILTPLNPTFI